MRVLGAAGHDQQHRFEVLEPIAAPNGLGVVAEFAAARARTNRPLKVTLPGPYTLSGRLSYGPGKVYGESRRRGGGLRADPPGRAATASPTRARRSSRSTSRRRRSTPTPRPTSRRCSTRRSSPSGPGSARRPPVLRQLPRPAARRALLPADPRRDARLRRRRARARVRQPRDGRGRDPPRAHRRRPGRRGRRHRRQELPPRDRPTRSPARIEAVLATGVPADRLTLVPDCGFSQTARWATTRQARGARRRARSRPRRVAAPIPNPGGSPQMTGPQHHDARHRADRRLLHEHAPRPARPRPRPRRLLAERGARRRVQRALGHPRVTRPTWQAAINHPDTDVVVVGLPNFLHEEAVELVAAAGKAVLCTKPLGRTAEEARRMLEAVEKAGVFGGYLEDLVLHAEDAQGDRVRRGAARSATSPGSARARRIPGRTRAWFWDGRLTGGGAIIDLGCHCIEIIRNFVGKGNRPVEVMCHTDTLVHPIADEDNAIALIRFESGAIGQFEVSWTFRGGMDLRDEVAGTHGTIWLNHFLRTGFEMFTAGGGRRLRRREGRDVGGLAVPGRRRGRRARLRRHVHATCSGRIDEGRRAAGDVLRRLRRQRGHGRRYRSAKTRAWEPVELRVARRQRRRGSRPTPETLRGPGRHQARDPARRPPQADPQGPGDAATSRDRVVAGT